MSHAGKKKTMPKSQKRYIDKKIYQNPFRDVKAWFLFKMGPWFNKSNKQEFDLSHKISDSFIRISGLGCLINLIDIRRPCCQIKTRAYLINGNHEWVVVLVSSLYRQLQTSWRWTLTTAAAADRHPELHKQSIERVGHCLLYTPPVSEVLCAKNGRAIVVCGFLMK